MRSKTIYAYYKALRRYHNIRAYQALRMARARHEFEKVGGEFVWHEEREWPQDVFGSACPKRNCRNPKCMNVHYDEDAEFYWLALKVNGLICASLSMIDGVMLCAGMRDYSFLVECELSVEAIVNMPVEEEVC